MNMDTFLWAWMGLALGVLVLLLFVSAPYGRHQRVGWGPVIPARWGWVVMETPCVVIMAWLFVSGGASGLVPWVFFAMWQLHYVHRSWVYPFRTQKKQRTMPMVVALMAIAFNSVNATTNGIALFGGNAEYSTAWLVGPQFVLGASLFFVGLAINWHSDKILLDLRQTVRAGEYGIPRGGLFRFVSCPNYFGEIIEWIGWAVLTGSLAGAVFAVWVVANLLPRAINHHRWYRERFADYPRSRKALVPYLL
jgi:protein-S-isoprenylcysteine O-methyltransferase Ste14